MYSFLPVLFSNLIASKEPQIMIFLTRCIKSLAVANIVEPLLYVHSAVLHVLVSYF